MRRFSLLSRGGEAWKSREQAAELCYDLAAAEQTRGAAFKGTSMGILGNRRFVAVGVLALFVSLVFAGCGYDAPDQATNGPSVVSLVPATIALQVLQTDAQTAIRADVRTIDRLPVAGAIVRFSASQGAMSPEATTTDSTGVAYVVWSGVGAAVITAAAGPASASTTVTRTLKPLDVQLSVTPLVRYSPGTFSATTFDMTPPATYAWSFGDGATTVTSTNTTTHTYQNDDATLASVTVSDAAGRTGTGSTSLRIAQPAK
jgi:hypothetical protein